jgi:hypothetical protein
MVEALERMRARAADKWRVVNAAMAGACVCAA